MIMILVFIPLFYFVTNSFLQISQGTNITSMDGKPMSMGTGTIIAPSETTFSDDIDNTDSDSDYSYMFYYYSDNDNEDSESDNEDSDGISVNTPRSVLSSKLFSCCLSTDSSSDSDAITDVNNANDSIYVVAGCRMCMLYIMVPAGTSVCFRCGNSGLIHFGGSGQA